MARWGDEKTLKFIILYRDNECLWNVRSLLYKNKGARESAYRNILEAMDDDDDLNVKTIKTKIKNLRSIYHTELKKVNDSKRFQDGSSVYRPSLSWFDEMHLFLGEFVEHRDTEIVERRALPSSAEKNTEIMSTQQSTMDHSTDNMILEGEYFTDEIIVPNNSDDSVGTSMPSTPRKEQSRRSDQWKTSRRKRPSCDNGTSVSNAALQLSEDSSSNTTQRHADAEDEFHYFELSVAAQLRKLPLVAALDMQAKIQSMLSAARLQSILEKTSASS